MNKSKVVKSKIPFRPRRTPVKPQRKSSQSQVKKNPSQSKCNTPQRQRISQSRSSQKNKKSSSSRERGKCSGVNPTNTTGDVSSYKRKAQKGITYVRKPPSKGRFPYMMFEQLKVVQLKDCSKEVEKLVKGFRKVQRSSSREKLGSAVQERKQRLKRRGVQKFVQSIRTALKSYFVALKQIDNQFLFAAKHKAIHSESSLSSQTDRLVRQVTRITKREEVLRLLSELCPLVHSSPFLSKMTRLISQIQQGQSGSRQKQLSLLQLQSLKSKCKFSSPNPFLARKTSSKSPLTWNQDSDSRLREEFLTRQRQAITEYELRKKCQRCQIFIFKRTGFITNTVAVQTFLVKLIDLLLNKAEHIFPYLNIAFGKSYVNRLANLQGRPLNLKARVVQQDHCILSDKLFQELTNKLGKTSKDQQVHHMKAIFDAFNFELNYFRPYFQLNGEPFPWTKDPRTLTFYNVDAQVFGEVLLKCKDKIIGYVDKLCGVILEKNIQTVDSEIHLSSCLRDEAIAMYRYYKQDARLPLPRTKAQERTESGGEPLAQLARKTVGAGGRALSADSRLIKLDFPRTHCRSSFRNYVFSLIHSFQTLLYVLPDRYHCAHVHVQATHFPELRDLHHLVQHLDQLHRAPLLLVAQQQHALLRKTKTLHGL